MLPFVSVQTRLLREFRAKVTLSEPAELRPSTPHTRHWPQAKIAVTRVLQSQAPDVKPCTRDSVPWRIGALGHQTRYAHKSAARPLSQCHPDLFVKQLSSHRALWRDLVDLRAIRGIPKMSHFMTRAAQLLDCVAGFLMHQSMPMVSPYLSAPSDLKLCITSRTPTVSEQAYIRV